MSEIKAGIPLPFDPELFRKEGHVLVDTLSDYLGNALAGKEMPVLLWNDPDQLTELFALDSGGGEKESVDSFIKRIIDNSIHIHHPHYIGHQVTSPLPVTALVQFCTTLLNNGAAIYEMGPVNMAMEKNVINKFGSLIGFLEGFDGIFTKVTAEDSDFLKIEQYILKKTPGYFFNLRNFSYLHGSISIFPCQPCQCNNRISRLF